MEGKYPILQNGTETGQVQVIRQGLYYHFSCCCKYQGDAICRLMIHCAESEFSLGIMVPEGDLFSLKKNIPIKQLPSGVPEFYIGSREVSAQAGVFAEISPEEPFEYLAKLKNAFLTYRNGKPGAWIPD